MTRLLVAGDVHGNMWHLLYLALVAEREQVDGLVFVGDTGYLWTDNFIDAMGTVARKLGVPVMWVDGNHDDHEMIDRLIGAHSADRTAPVELWPDRAPGVYYVPRGAVWEFGGQRIMGVGGAVSVDQSRRTRFVEYWPQEALSYPDVERACAAGPVDIMFTHDAPYGTSPMEQFIDLTSRVLPDRLVRESASHRLALATIVETVRPRLLVHGHHHHRYDGVHRADNGWVTKVVGLGRDKQGDRSWVIIDLNHK